jgi:glycerol uptake facilitator-like aquaporin
VGILFGNMILVSTLISATGSATGAHINSMVTIATAFSGHCHPVRAIIYIFCQVAGGSLGGILLRFALGEKFAYQNHNTGCWLEPGGEIDVWQAALIEVACSFILLSVVSLLLEFILNCYFHLRFVAYGVGLDPRQAKLFGAKYGPVLVGLIVGLL